MRVPDSVRVLLRFLRFRPSLVVAYAATDVAWSYAMFLIPGLVLRALLDAVSNGERAGAGVWSLLALLAAAQVSAFLVGGLGGWFSHQRAEQTYASLARANLLRRLLRCPAAAALPVPPAEALARFDSDVSLVGGEVVVLETLAEAAVVVAAVVLLYLLAGAVAAFVVAPLVIVVVGVRLAVERLQGVREALQESTARLTGFVGGIFGALVVVLTTGDEAAVGARFRRLVEERRRALLRDALLTQVLRGLSSQTYGIAIGAVLLLLAARVEGGAMSVGDLALVVTYAGSVATMGTWMAGDLAAWRQYGVSLRRLIDLVPGTESTALAEPRDVLRGELTLATPSPAARPLRALSVRGLTCRLGNRDAGVFDVDLEVTPGEMVVATGRVGAGKTTLLRALLGMLPASGEILWNGELVSDPARFLVPPRCGYLPQAPVLLSGTLREDLLLGLPEDPEQLERAVSDAALDADLARFATGLETAVGRRGLRLSGGQVQRVALARLLVRQPQLAVLDDLSSALDPTTEEVVVRRLRRRSMACLAVSHRRGVLAAADRIVVLEAGRVTATGSLPELLASSAELHAVWHGEDRTALVDFPAR